MAIPSPCLGEKEKAIIYILSFHQREFSHIFRKVSRFFIKRIFGILILVLTKIMKFMDFTIIIEQDDPSGWHAYCPELVGCHSFGDSPEEAKENLTEAIYAYVLEKNSQQKKIHTKRKFFDHLSVALPA